MVLQIKYKRRRRERERENQNDVFFSHLIRRLVSALGCGCEATNGLFMRLSRAWKILFSSHLAHLIFEVILLLSSVSPKGVFYLLSIYLTVRNHYSFNLFKYNIFFFSFAFFAQGFIKSLLIRSNGSRALERIREV